MRRTRQDSAKVAECVPDEILLLILSPLAGSLGRPDALLRCSLVCKHWRTLVMDTESLWRVVDFSQCLRMRKKDDSNLWSSPSGPAVVSTCRRIGGSIRELSTGWYWPRIPISPESYNRGDMDDFLEMLRLTPSLEVLTSHAGVDWIYHYKGVRELLLPAQAAAAAAQPAAGAAGAAAQAALQPHPYAAAALLPAVVTALCNSKMHGGYTALMTSTRVGNGQLVSSLLALPGVPLNHQIEDGSSNTTALKMASLRGREDIVALLLAAPGIDVNLSDRDGGTALMCAAFAGHTEVTRLLLAVPGIEVGARGIVGDQENGRMEGTALEMALRGAHHEVATLLQAAAGAV